MSRAFSTGAEFVATRYRYADGVKYKYDQNRYDLMVNVGTAKEPYYRAMGGMRVCSNKVIAYIGATSLSSRVKDIVAHAGIYVWGDDIAKALAAIKPHLIEARSQRE